jgi:hypothetical protein
MGISISKKGQQISKFTNPTKYAQPSKQMLTTQYVCTDGTTTIPDVTTMIVTKKTTQLQSRRLTYFNYQQLSILWKCIYFPCLNFCIPILSLSMSFILSWPFILSLYKFSITPCRGKSFRFVSHRVL